MNSIFFYFYVFIITLIISLDLTAQSFDSKLIENFRNGITVIELNEYFPNLDTKEVPMFYFGIDSESSGTLFTDKEDSLFFVWNKHGENNIHEIVIMSEKISLPKGIHVGMEISNIININQNFKTEIEVIEEKSEYFSDNETGILFEFFTNSSNRVSTYNFDNYLPIFLEVKRPEAKVDRIRIGKSVGV